MQQYSNKVLIVSHAHASDACCVREASWTTSGISVLHVQPTHVPTCLVNYSNCSQVLPGGEGEIVTGAMNRWDACFTSADMAPAKQETYLLTYSLSHGFVLLCESTGPIVGYVQSRLGNVPCRCFR